MQAAGYKSGSQAAPAAATAQAAAAAAERCEETGRSEESVAVQLQTKSQINGICCEYSIVAKFVQYYNYCVIFVLCYLCFILSLY